MKQLPKDVQAVLERLEPEFRAAFVQAIADVRSAAQLQTVIGHIEAGNVEAAVTALRLDPMFFDPLDRALRNAFVSGGINALSRLPALPDPFLMERLSELLSRAEDLAPSNGSHNDPEH